MAVSKAANDPYGLSLGNTGLGVGGGDGGDLTTSSLGTAPGAGGGVSMKTTVFVDPEQRAHEALNRDGALDLGRWVVVFGFTPGDYTSPIRALQQHGSITRHCLGGGTMGGRRNYLFVQFATVMDRDHAVAQGPSLLNDSVLVSVSSLTPELAERLRFDDALRADDLDKGARSGSLGGGLAEGGNVGGGLGEGGGAVLRGPLSPLLRSPKERMPVRRASKPYYMRTQGGRIDGDRVFDGTIAQPPRRHVNFCKKVMRFLFGW